MDPLHVNRVVSAGVRVRVIRVPRFLVRSVMCMWENADSYSKSDFFGLDGTTGAYSMKRTSPFLLPIVMMSLILGCAGLLKNECLQADREEDQDQGKRALFLRIDG